MKFPLRPTLGVKPAFLDDTNPPPVRLSRAGRPLVSSKGGGGEKCTNIPISSHAKIIYIFVHVIFILAYN